MIDIILFKIFANFENIIIDKILKVLFN